MTNKTNILQLPDTKILVLVISNNPDRKLVHQYLDGKVFKSSTVVDSHFRQKQRLYRKCYSCEKMINISEYRKGIMKNGKDEYYRGWCDDCDGSVIFEPNYDDYEEIKVIRANNAIVIGNCLRHWSSPPYATKGNVNKGGVADILDKAIYYILDAPKDKLLSKKKLRSYINTKIK